MDHPGYLETDHRVSKGKLTGWACHDFLARPVCCIAKAPEVQAVPVWKRRHWEETPSLDRKEHKGAPGSRGERSPACRRAPAASPGAGRGAGRSSGASPGPRGSGWCPPPAWHTRWGGDSTSARGQYPAEPSASTMASQREAAACPRAGLGQAAGREVH